MGSCWAWPRHTSPISPGSCHPAPGPPRQGESAQLLPVQELWSQDAVQATRMEPPARWPRCTPSEGARWPWPLTVHPQAQGTEGT